MKRPTVLLAALAGCGVYVVGSVLDVWFLLEWPDREYLHNVLYGTVTFSAFLAAYLAPNHKALVGISTAIYGVVISRLSAPAYRMVGIETDAPIADPPIELVVYLVVALPWVLLGVAVALLLSGEYRKE